MVPLTYVRGGVVREHVKQGVGLAFGEEFVAEADVARDVEDLGLVVRGGDGAGRVAGLAGEEVWGIGLAVPC